MHTVYAGDGATEATIVARAELLAELRRLVSSMRWRRDRPPAVSLKTL